jgi:transcriptional regulator with XRE-family HTH domain
MANLENNRSMAIHHGRNVRRFREMRQMKQEALAERLGEEWTQQTISKLEARETIDEPLMKKIAKALDIAPEFIEKFNDDTVTQFFNTFHDQSTGTFQDYATGINNHCTFNPLDKYVEMVERYNAIIADHKALYEQLLKAEREKYALLEKMLSR